MLVGWVQGERNVLALADQMLIDEKLLVGANVHRPGRRRERAAAAAPDHDSQEDAK